jgi:serine/threonine protein kinase
MNQEEFRNRYRFHPNQDYIGGGGFGKVYRAYDSVKRHYVAIKVSEVKQEWKHFTLQREVEIVNKMPHHQNIARYDSCHRFDMGMVGTMDFAVLKYYENGNFEQFLKKHTLSELETEQVIRGILEGIVFLHKNRIIHRDLKSQNILIDREDGIWVPKITDFGLSRQVTQDSTGTNSVVGISFAYAAPEQIQNRPIQQNVDLWAAGVIIYRMIAGELPFKSSEHTEERDNTQSQMELCRKITHGELPEKLKSLPEPYKTLISKCLVLDTKKRVQHAEDLLYILDTYTPPSQPAPAEIPVIDAPTSSEPTTIWTAEQSPSQEQSLPQINSEAATTLFEAKSSGKPAPSANAAEQPTLLKDNLDKLTVLKNNSGTSSEKSKDNLDKPTVLKDSLDKPTVLKNPSGTSADKPTVLKNPSGTSADKPTVLKNPSGTSADKPTVLKNPSGTSADKPTVLKNPSGTSADKPTDLMNDLDKPTVLKNNSSISAAQPDDFKKQLKLWGGIAAVVCLFGVIFGYCKGQKNKKIVEAVAPALDSANAQKFETALITVESLPDTTTAIAVPATTIAPTTASLPAAAAAKKPTKESPKPGKTATATTQPTPVHPNEWTVAPAPDPTPVKPATPEIPKAEPAKTEPSKPVLAPSLDNMSDFTGENGLIHKHLNKVKCDNFTVSFIIKANGMIAEPQLVKGDKKCENVVLAQIRSLPQLKTPLYDKKPADYKYFFTKR